MFRIVTRALATTGLVAAATLGAGGIGSTAQAADAARVCYSPHVQNVGWKGESCNGAWAGSIGEARHLEALRVTVNYGKLCMKAHRTNYGWDQHYQCAEPGKKIQIGTEGMNTPIEAISMYYCPPGSWGGPGDILADAHVRNIGDVSYGSSPLAQYRAGCKDETMLGTTGRGLPMEAVKLWWAW
ncbi:hypothetical protein [Streptomyces sp. MN13]